MYDASCMRAYIIILQDGLEKRKRNRTHEFQQSRQVWASRETLISDASAGGRLAGVMNIKPWTSLRFYTVYKAVVRRVRGPGAGGARGGKHKY